MLAEVEWDPKGGQLWEAESRARVAAISCSMGSRSNTELGKPFDHLLLRILFRTSPFGRNNWVCWLLATPPQMASVLFLVSLESHTRRGVPSKNGRATQAPGHSPRAGRESGHGCLEGQVAGGRVRLKPRGLLEAEPPVSRT